MTRIHIFLCDSANATSRTEKKSKVFFSYFFSNKTNDFEFFETCFLSSGVFNLRANYKQLITKPKVMSRFYFLLLVSGEIDRRLKQHKSIWDEHENRNIDQWLGVDFPFFSRPD